MTYCVVFYVAMHFNCKFEMDRKYSRAYSMVRNKIPESDGNRVYRNYVILLT